MHTPFGDQAAFLLAGLRRLWGTGTAAALAKVLAFRGSELAAASSRDPPPEIILASSPEAAVLPAAQIRTPTGQKVAGADRQLHGGVQLLRLRHAGRLDGELLLHQLRPFGLGQRVQSGLARAARKRWAAVRKDKAGDGDGNAGEARREEAPPDPRGARASSRRRKSVGYPPGGSGFRDTVFQTQPPHPATMSLIAETRAPRRSSLPRGAEAELHYFLLNAKLHSATAGQAPHSGPLV